MNANTALIQHMHPQTSRDTAQGSRAPALALRNSGLARYGAYVDVAAQAAEELRTRTESSSTSSVDADADAAHSSTMHSRTATQTQQPARETGAESSSAPPRSHADGGRSSNGTPHTNSPRSGASRDQPDTTDSQAAHGATGVTKHCGTRSAAIPAGIVAAPGPSAQASQSTSAHTQSNIPGVTGSARRNQPNALQSLNTLAASGREQLQRRQVVEQSLRAIHATIRKDGGEATLKLRPEGLGALDVRVEVRGESVWAWLRPTTTTAQQLLETSVEELRAGLEQRGLRVEHLGIEPVTRKASDVAEPTANIEGGHTPARDEGSTGGGPWNGPSQQYEDSGGAGVGQEREEPREHDSQSHQGHAPDGETLAVLGWIA